jgi:hypothetical protein
MSDPVELSPEIVVALRELQRAVIRHPLAAQAIFAALIAEGRAYATTDEGKAWRERLARSETTRRMLTTWEMASMGMLTEASGDFRPTALFEALARAAAAPWFEGKVAHALGLDSGSIDP